MPPKKGTKAKTQKQKQKQKQTVIVNINEKPKTKRKRKPTAPIQRKPVGASSHIPLDAVRDILFQLSKGTHTPDPIMARVMASTKPNPQAEIIKDEQEKATLPNRPPATMPENDAALIRLRAKSIAQSPFIFPEAEEKQEDVHRFESKLISPTTPFNAYLEQRSQHETPLLHQPPPQIHITEGPSGTDPIGEVDYDAIEEREPDAEVAKDNQEIFDYVKSIGLSLGRTGQEHQQLMERRREPTFAEKAGFAVAESRFTSPEAPFAEARPAVAQAGAHRVNPNTRSSLQQANFRNAGEARDAIQTWSRFVPESEGIHVTRSGGRGYKSLGELEAELKTKGLTFSDIKAFSDQHTVVSPHKTKERGGKKAVLETALDGSDI